MKKYWPRLVDKLLEQKLQYMGAILIEGPKWCGKTSTAERQAKSIFYMDDNESGGQQNIEVAKMSPKNALNGDTPRLIDEWQLVPSLWDAIRHEVDHASEPGKFILTGSATPADMSKVHHSGVGRFSTLTMRPMSLAESGESTGAVSLRGLFDAPDDVSGDSNVDLDQLAHLCCRGGWPRAVMSESRFATDLANEYYEGLINFDISKVDDVRRDPTIARKIMRNYARAQGQQVSLASLRNDINGSDTATLSIDSVQSYTEALRKIFIIEDVDAWNPNLRSKTAVRTSDTRYFVDPSLATSALGAEEGGLIADLKTFGFIFETLCMRDLRVYMEAQGGGVSHYRDSNGLECDAVLRLRDGRYGLVQMKLGANSENIEDGASKLAKLLKAIDSSKMPLPTFMMVITGNGRYAYRREDGIYVVPVGSLRD